jgi:ATP-dependent DNA ligase
MLATLTDERFSRAGWLFEPKWDGERCLAFRHGRDLRLMSRNQKRLNEKYPEITAAFSRQGADFFIADGEIVTFTDGVTSFTKLQQRMQVEHPSADLLRRAAGWALFAVGALTTIPLAAEVLGQRRSSTSPPLHGDKRPEEVMWEG